MTRTTNARVAGAAYLVYIAVAFPAMVIEGRATRGQGLDAQLATLAQGGADVRLSAVLALLGCLCALVLAVTLYAVTRDQDRDVAMLGLVCRVGEGIVGAASVQASSHLLWLAAAAAPSADLAAARALGDFLLHSGFGRGGLIGGWFFAVGSTAFCWLLLRGRMIPAVLAWLGVVASALLVVALPLQLLGLVSGLVAQLVWIPMAAFEIPGGVWLLVKGVPEAPLQLLSCRIHQGVAGGERTAIAEWRICRCRERMWVAAIASMSTETNTQRVKNRTRCLRWTSTARCPWTRGGSGRPPTRWRCC